jgi:hypothetical protein
LSCFLLLSTKASGKIEVWRKDSNLKNSIPSTISRPRKNKTNDPAMAKEEMSTPNNLRKGSPINRKNSNIT